MIGSKLYESKWIEINIKYSRIGTKCSKDRNSLRMLQHGQRVTIFLEIFQKDMCFIIIGACEKNKKQQKLIEK